MLNPHGLMKPMAMAPSSVRRRGDVGMFAATRSLPRPVVTPLVSGVWRVLSLRLNLTSESNRAARREDDVGERVSYWIRVKPERGVIGEGKVVLARRTAVRIVLLGSTQFQDVNV